MSRPGGGQEGNESAVETMNREFLEETGSSIGFSEERDYCFSYVKVVGKEEIHLITMFCRMTSDLVEFNAILSNFHSGDFKSSLHYFNHTMA